MNKLSINILTILLIPIFFGLTFYNYKNCILVHYRSKYLEVVSPIGVLLYRTSISAGENSELGYYSNEPNSHESSLGKFILRENCKTGGSYCWKLQGLNNTNSNAYDRGIELHAASYVPKGHTWGCVAVSYSAMNRLHTLIGSGSYLIAEDN